MTAIKTCLKAPINCTSTANRPINQPTNQSNNQLFGRGMNTTVKPHQEQQVGVESSVVKLEMVPPPDDNDQNQLRQKYYNELLLGWQSDCRCCCTQVRRE